MTGSEYHFYLNACDLKFLTVFKPFIGADCHGGSHHCSHIKGRIGKHFFFGFGGIDLNSFLPSALRKARCGCAKILRAHNVIEMTVGKKERAHMKSGTFYASYDLFAGIGRIKNDAILLSFSVCEVTVCLNGTYYHSADFYFTHYAPALSMSTTPCTERILSQMFSSSSRPWISNVS